MEGSCSSSFISKRRVPVNLLVFLAVAEIEALVSGSFSQLCFKYTKDGISITKASQKQQLIKPHVNQVSSE